MTRPGWDDYFLGIAEAVAARADCTRRRVGAVIVDTDHRIISAGYNGAPPGKPGCLSDGACPRGRHMQSTMGPTECLCGAEWPCPQAVAPGSSYDNPASPGYCTAVHAESNALLFARTSVKGCVMYVTDVPCDGCSKLIEASGISKSVYMHKGKVYAFHHGVRY